jgi:hypothetical protein
MQPPLARGKVNDAKAEDGPAAVVAGADGAIMADAVAAAIAVPAAAAGAK